MNRILNKKFIFKTFLVLCTIFANNIICNYKNSSTTYGMQSNQNSNEKLTDSNYYKQLSLKDKKIAMEKINDFYNKNNDDYLQLKLLACEAAYGPEYKELFKREHFFVHDDKEPLKLDEMAVDFENLNKVEIYQRINEYDKYGNRRNGKGKETINTLCMDGTFSVNFDESNKIVVAGWKELIKPFINLKKEKEEKGFSEKFENYAKKLEAKKLDAKKFEDDEYI